MRRKMASMVLAALMPATQAQAVISFDAVLPQHIQAGQQVSAQVTDGICDAVVAAPGYPQITQGGQHIRMLLETAHADSPIFCNFGPIVTFAIPVGSYAPGVYSLQVDRHYIDTDATSVTATLGTRMFTVNAPPQPAPALGAAGYGLLVGLTLIAALVALKRRTRTN